MRTGSLFPRSTIMFDLSLSFARSCLDVLPETAIGRNLNLITYESRFQVPHGGQTRIRVTDVAPYSLFGAI